MKRSKPMVMKFLALTALTLVLGLGGCVGYIGAVDEGPEWDGGVVVVGGGGGYDRGYHNQAFRAEGRRPAHVGSARGRASMGARAGGGGPASGGGHR